MIKVLFICHGNICRSTMAQFVFADLVKRRHVDHLFIIDSAATSREEIGNPPHHGTVRKCREKGVPVLTHYATQLTRADYDNYDYLIGMDSANFRNISRLAGAENSHKVHLLLDYTNRPGSVADPWYTGDFQETYEDVMVGCEALLKLLVEKHFS